MTDVDIKVVGALRQQNIGRLFQRAARAYSELAMQKLQTAGYDNITLVHTALIANLDIDGTRISTLADRAGISKQAMGQLANELENQQLIQRKPDPSDRRATLICFTDSGLQFLQDAYHLKLEIEAEYAAVLGAEGMETLRELLENLLNAE
ncbi:MAG: MarR family winged helix-turn-helix transcriptional regulator [Aggregatilineales bacterium]